MENGDGEYMFKVMLEYASQIFVADTDLTVMPTFRYYCMEVDDGLLNQGYYALMTVMNKSEDEDEDDTLPLSICK